MRNSNCYVQNIFARSKIHPRNERSKIIEVFGFIQIVPVFFCNQNSTQKARTGKMRTRKGANGRNHWSEYREKSSHENRGYVARFRIRDNGTFTHSPCPFVPGPFFHGCCSRTLFDAGNARGQNVFHHRDFESIPILISSPSLAIFFFSFFFILIKSFPFFFLTSSLPFCVCKFLRVSISL